MIKEEFEEELDGIYSEAKGGVVFLPNDELKNVNKVIRNPSTKYRY